MAGFRVDNCTFVLHADASWRDIGGEVVAINVESGDYFVFSEVGRLLWLAMAEGRSFDETVAHITREYEVEPDVVRADAVRFLQALEGVALVMVSAQG